MFIKFTTFADKITDKRNEQTDKTEKLYPTHRFVADRAGNKDDKGIFPAKPFYRAVPTPRYRTFVRAWGNGYKRRLEWSGTPRVVPHKGFGRP